MSPSALRCCLPGILSGLHRMESGMKAGNGEKMGNQMGNRPELDKGKNGQKMACTWRKYGTFPRISFSSPVFGHLYPCQARGCFPFGFHFLPISGFHAVLHSIQARQNPNASLGNQSKTRKVRKAVRRGWITCSGAMSADIL